MQRPKKGHWVGVRDPKGTITSTHTSIWAAKTAQKAVAGSMLVGWQDDQWIPVEELRIYRRT